MPLPLSDNEELVARSILVLFTLVMATYLSLSEQGGGVAWFLCSIIPVGLLVQTLKKRDPWVKITPPRGIQTFVTSWLKPNFSHLNIEDLKVKHESGHPTRAAFVLRIELSLPFQQSKFYREVGFSALGRSHDESDIDVGEPRFDGIVKISGYSADCTAILTAKVRRTLRTSLTKLPLRWTVDETGVEVRYDAGKLRTATVKTISQWVIDFALELNRGAATIPARLLHLAQNERSEAMRALATRQLEQAFPESEEFQLLCRMENRAEHEGRLALAEVASGELSISDDGGELSLD